ncbi:hypothetical protein INS49_015804 [Diaporthe citri]|uniref:uncharacterized protein n=1 Tax=Diaporthe citri TaxID=83186 RepID=UPI001C8258DE|nr:uncharacterized protein INS49_015804 [Diaporthe citri]KAG6356416.1 hypothetical protein INS49_015804 [Diaporthe citri]
MPYDPDFKDRQVWHDGVDEDIALAQRFNNRAIPELLDRMITHGRLGDQLQYLSIRDFTLQFKAGSPPGATLSSVTTMGIPRWKGDFPHLFIHEFPKFQMEALLRSFPNLRAFQNDEAAFSWRDAIGEFDPTFSNANVFNSVHHCLRRLTYLSNTITQSPNPENYFIAIDCYEEEKFSDVPHFAVFKVLEELTIEQGLLGRLSTVHDRVNSPTGPYFPDLDYRLPQSLRRLTIKFVYDWPRLASQLIALATAKQRGQFPSLSDVFVVIVRSCTVESDGVWPPHIPLTPSKDLIRDSGELMRAAGINLWTSTTEIEPPDSEDYPHDIVPEGTLITFDVQRRFFSDT